MKSVASVGRAGWPLADLALATFVMLSIGMLIVPLPTPLLDLLLAGNLALACVLLFSALYVPHGLALATLPTLLLVTTLYRLALNVSSTRLILLQADAGRVIRAFGEFVVQGNYVVGGVMFGILTLIQYLVIAKGSERVAEVGARFSLDAMPGKQLAIDADLRAGALHVDAARKRRAALEQESHFYGAMDGAMKFVKGDAIAGIAIAVISLVGGTAIGVGMRGLTLAESARRYGLLTIGDGLVAQVPSLVISIAAGLVVTRVAAREHERSLAQDIERQLFSEPRVLGAAAVFLLVLALVPGLPMLPFAAIAVGLAGLTHARVRARRAALGARHAAGDAADAGFLLELGRGLARDLSAERERAELSAIITRHERTLRATLGVTLPAPRTREDTALPDDGYVVSLHGLPIERGRAPQGVRALLAQLDGALGPLLFARARDLFGLDDLRRALDDLSERQPALVQSVVPAPVSMTTLTETLRRLLDEGVSIRPLSRILEALGRDATRAGDAEALAESARGALREQIVHAAARDGVLHVHRIDPLIEDSVREAVRLRGGNHHHALALPSALARDIVGAVARARSSDGEAPVLLTQPDLRRAFFELLSPELRDVCVLSYAELPPDALIETHAPIVP